MSAMRRVVPLMLIISLGLLLASCQSEEKSADNFQWKPLFGNGLHDSSPVIAQVGDIEITQLDLDMRYDELPPKLKNKYAGEEGQRLLLKDMVEQTLMVLGAVELGLHNDSNVARTLISQRRSTMDLAMRNLGLYESQKPTQDEVKDFFDKNRAMFRQEGMSLAQHVECLNQADAEQAYERLLMDGLENNFAHVVRDFSKNIETGKDGGQMGWFNKGGFIPFINNSVEFTNIAADLEIGLHPPFRIGDRWHVVEILKKEHGRPMTFKEAESQVLGAMLPGHQDALVKDYLLSARVKHPVAMMGRFAPGQGMSPESLFARGMAIADPQAKLDVFALVYTDFPESDKADDALFMSAMVAMDTWQDRRVAERYLRQMLEDYPDSELAEDAQFLKENMYNPKALNPSSIEELRK